MKHNQLIDGLLSSIESGKSAGGIKLAQIVKRLTEMEVDEGGPYSFEPKQGANDIGLNLAIACFLALQDIRLPKLDYFLEKRILNIAKPFGSVINNKTVRSLIGKYQTLTGNMHKEEPVKQPIVYNDGEERIMDMIRKKFDDRFSNFSPALRERAKSAVEKTIRGNRDKQMSLMAHYTRAAFGREGEKITDETVAEMGLANIFFWTAFIIYDDFWDEDEATDPKLLPVANIFARHYIDFFSTLLPEETGFRSFFQTLMDKLDAANAWETEYCRTRVEGPLFHIPKTLPKYGDYENKYQPASGHILGSLAIFVMQGYAPSSSEAKHFISYLKHYLIAMQLNDDAHDWEEDLARGHLSTVVVLLLADLKEFGWKKSTIDLVVDIPELKKIFWLKTMPQYVKLALSNTTKSKVALLRISTITNPSIFEQIINKIENAPKLAKKEYIETQELLKEYSI